MSTLARHQSRVALMIPLALLVLTYALAPAKFYVDSSRVQIDAGAFEKRVKAEELSAVVRKHIKPGEKVYFIAQNTNGYERQLFDYAMVPYAPNDCWSVGKRYNEGDVWTCDRPLEMLLQSFNYLAIYQADDAFWANNRDLFAADSIGGTTGVYRIQRKDNGHLLLSRVQ